MKSAPPRVDHCIGAPLTLPLPPAANSTSSGSPCTSAADHVPMSAGLADALAAKIASAKVNRIFLMVSSRSVRRWRHGKWRERFVEHRLQIRGQSPENR